MEINQLKYFKAVAETGKMVLAAERMFVTPSAISASISSLEKELGMPLFIRKGNRLLLNRQGEILLGHAEYILQYVADAQSDLMESCSKASNRITVSVTSANIWHEMITEFSLKHPEIVLGTHTINASSIINTGIERRGLFLLTTEGEVSESFKKTKESIYLFDDSPVVMVSPEHPLAQKEIIEPEELAGQALIWSRASYSLYKNMCNIFKTRDLPVPVLSTLTHQVSLSLVRRNAGIALTTARVKTRETEDICFIPLNAPECRWPHRLYWDKGHELDHAEKSFVDFIKDFYGQ